MTDSRTALAESICRVAHLRGDFLLRSGVRSDHYFDKYQFEADPALLHGIAQGLAPLLPEETELLGGLELGGVPIATAVSLLTGIPMVMVRKAAKTYGTMKLAEGPSVSGRRVTLVEDVVTSGGQVCESAAALRERGAIVDTVVCVIDREGGGTEALRAMQLELRPLFTKSDLDDWLPGGRGGLTSEAHHE